MFCNFSALPIADRGCDRHLVRGPSDHRGAGVNSAEGAGAHLSLVSGSGRLAWHPGDAGAAFRPRAACSWCDERVGHSSCDDWCRKQRGLGDFNPPTYGKRDYIFDRLLFSLICALAGLATWPFGWVTPTWPELVALAAIGLCGGLGHIFLTESYRLAPASVVAPFDYTAMIWVFLLGYFFLQRVAELLRARGDVHHSRCGLIRDLARTPARLAAHAGSRRPVNCRPALISACTRGGLPAGRARSQAQASAIRERISETLPRLNNASCGAS